MKILSSFEGKGTVPTGGTTNQVLAKNSNTNHDLSWKDLTTLVNAVILASHPVGSIEINMSGANPSTYVGGGTWVLFGQGRTLIGVDTGQTEFNTVEKTGGSKTHTLSIAEIPNHNHTGDTTWGGTHRHNSQGYFTFNAAAGTKNSMARSRIGTDPVDDSSILDSGNHYHSFTTSSVGSGSAHNNLQPYITCYMWKRTA